MYSPTSRISGTSVSRWRVMKRFTASKSSATTELMALKSMK